MLKTQCFLHFSCWEGILKVSFCRTAWANSKLRRWYFVQSKRSFFYHTGKTLGNCSSSRNSMSLRLERIVFQLCHKHAGSSSKIELVMEALCLHWKLRAHFQRFSLVPPWDLSFWAKAIGFHFFKTFPCGVKLLGACDNKAVVELHSGY